MTTKGWRKHKKQPVRRPKKLIKIPDDPWDNCPGCDSNLGLSGPFEGHEVVCPECGKKAVCIFFLGCGWVLREIDLEV